MRKVFTFERNITNMLSLFPDEKLITESTDGGIILTSQRICREEIQFGNANSQSIMLEHVTSCESSSKSKMWLLVLGILILILGAAIQSPIALLSILFFWVYFYSRKSVIIISSPSTKMEINVIGMKLDQVQSFINKVEHTKHQRLLDLNSKSNKF